MLGDVFLDLLTEFCFWVTYVLNKYKVLTAEAI